MAYNPLATDYMRPIRDDNREEILLVEFHRVLKNTNFSVWRNLLHAATRDPELSSIFPNITSFSSLKTVDEMCLATSLYNTRSDFLYFLSGEKLSMDLCNIYGDIFLFPLHLFDLPKTKLEFVLHELSDHNFVKGIYFFAPQFTREMKDYMATTFGVKGFSSGKLHLLEGSLEECMESIPNATTMFISNYSDWEQIYRKDAHAFDGKMVLIADGYSNIEPQIITDKPDILYKGMKTFMQLYNEKRAEISYMFPEFIPVDHNSQERKEPTT